MIPFNYHHLYYFYVIAQEGSISKATQVLHLAQPTLSAQLKQFESFLKTSLFIRDKKKLVLTEEGHRVLSYARMIFDIGQELKDRVVDLTDKEYAKITIGVPNFIPRTIVEKLLDFILRKEPKICVVVREDGMEKLLVDLQNHDLDLILTDTSLWTQDRIDIESRLMAKIPMVFCAHSSVARKIKKFPADLAKVPMILPAEPARIASLAREYLIEHALNPRIIAEIPDVELIRRLVLRGFGIALVNEVTAKEAPAHEKLVILGRHQKTGLYRNIYLITRKRKMPHPLVDKILNEFFIQVD